MDKLGTKLKQQVIGDGQQYTVHGFVDIYRPHGTVIFRDLSLMGRSDLVLAVAYPAVQPDADVGGTEVPE